MKDRVTGEMGWQEGDGLGRPLATSVFLLLSTNVTEGPVLPFFEDNCYVPFERKSTVINNKCCLGGCGGPEMTL